MWKRAKSKAGNGYMKSHSGRRGHLRSLVRFTNRHFIKLGSFSLVTSISDILIPYHRSLNSYIGIVNTLRSHSVSYETSKDAVNMWVAQIWLQEDGWKARWEDICNAEVEGWK